MKTNRASKVFRGLAAGWVVVCACLVGCGGDSGGSCTDNCDQAYEQCVNSAGSASAQVQCVNRRYSCVSGCLNAIDGFMTPPDTTPLNSGPSTVEGSTTVAR